MKAVVFARITGIAAAVFLLVQSCSSSQDHSAYHDNSGRADAWSGGERMIPISTPKGDFQVWTKRVGNNPDIKVLLLHGGPGATHEYLLAFDSYFPGASIEYYHYDQLGSFGSDQPDDDDLWTIPRFVDEVEQVRKALGLTKDNFYIYGSSWGGLLGMEYALKYQDNLKGLIISNMMASIPDYNSYAAEVLAERIDPDALAEIRALEAAEDFDNPRYMELLIPEHYERHVLRKPIDEWPSPVVRSFDRINPNVYVLMQGPSEFGASGRLVNWDIKDQLHKLSIPVLTIGGAWDTMDPAHMQWMADEVQNGRYLHCPNSGHLAMYDDQELFMEGVIRFIKDVDEGRM